jgi:hypothetical protein
VLVCGPAVSRAYLLSKIPIESSHSTVLSGKQQPDSCLPQRREAATPHNARCAKPADNVVADRDDRRHGWLSQRAFVCFNESRLDVEDLGATTLFKPMKSHNRQR